jgi:hypothetical protein
MDSPLLPLLFLALGAAIVAAAPSLLPNRSTQPTPPPTAPRTVLQRLQPFQLQRRGDVTMASQLEQRLDGLVDHLVAAWELHQHGPDRPATRCEETSCRAARGLLADAVAAGGAIVAREAMVGGTTASTDTWPARDHEGLG